MVRAPCVVLYRHALQLNTYHTQQAAKRVEAWFPQWDEGSKRGLTAVMVGACGVLNDIEAESLTSDDDFYRDALGFEILSSKTGKAVAEKLLAIFKRRGIEEYYFVGTDAVSSNIGHESGAIAYLRRDRGTPLIFALRCGGHIDMRAWKHGLEQTGTTATRSPIKRKADEATIPTELLAIEDLYYLEKKWPELGAAMQAQLPLGETNLKTSGCPDSRWTFWNELLRNKLGLTWILKRQVCLWRKAVDKWREEQAKEVIDESVVPLDQPLVGERVPLRIVKTIVAEDAFHCNLFDFADTQRLFDDDDEIRLCNFLDAYTGKRIRDDLNLTIQILGGDGVADALQPGGELHKEGATWPPPEDCPVSALTTETLPGLLLDISSQYMRVRMAVWEAVGSGYVMPFLHRKEMRYPGIVFEAHEIIGTQRDIGMLFGIDGETWAVAKVEEHSPRFSTALDAVIRYAQSINLEEYAVQFTDEYMCEHSEYYLEQTEEWWSNPVFRLAGIGSAVTDADSEYHGTFHARWLVEQTVPELRAALAKVLHISPAEVKAALNLASYDGPLNLLVDDTLWEQLVKFSKQKETLAECKGVDELRALLHKWYKPLFLTNVWMEELVKEFKNLTAQARAHATTAEVRAPDHQRACTAVRAPHLP